MITIAATFGDAATTGRKVFVPFLPIGYPSLAATADLMGALETAGADLIELGVPFSDSLADGPTIQHAYHEALAAGSRLERIFEFLRAQRSSRGLPFVLMCCYNIIHRMGPCQFVRRSHEAGVQGAIVPDLPFEESAGLKSVLDSEGLNLVSLIAPTTQPRRIATIASGSSGFIYYVSRRGVTGACEAPEAELARSVTTIRRFTRLPVVVGFGISTPAQAASVAEAADGVVVGSAFVDLIRESVSDPVGPVSQLASDFRRALDSMRIARRRQCPP